MLRIATTGIPPGQTALKWTADCQAPPSGYQEYMWSDRPVAILSQIKYFCLWQSAARLFSSWQSVVKTPRIATIRSTHLSAELSKRLNSGSSHFTSRVPLFEVSYLFAARPLEYKIPMWRIV
jgi:hypothetical protein